MGLLVDGKWQDKWYSTAETGGKFVRKESQFRNWVTPDGAPGPSGKGGFRAEPGRYHLYVSYACPWAHRTLIVRALKKLEDVISVSVVHHFMGEHGWTFLAEDGATGDTLYGLDYLHEIYTRADPDYSGRVTVPVLWDKQQQTIVSNESSEIIRMLNSAFDAWGDASVDLYPERLRGEIDRVNALVYPSVNNGVYRAGFADHAAGLRGGVQASCSPRSTRWRNGSAASAISPATSSPRPTGGCSPRWCASTRSMSATSNAICGGSPTTRTCRTICASSTRCPASPRP